jgi:hypothetical protein
LPRPPGRKRGGIKKTKSRNLLGRRRQAALWVADGISIFAEGGICYFSTPTWMVTNMAYTPGFVAVYYPIND